MFSQFQTPSPFVRRRRRIVGSLSTAVLATSLVGFAGAADAAPGEVGGQTAAQEGPPSAFVHVKKVEREVEDQRFRPDPLERETDKMKVGESKVIEPGRPGIRD